jgi:hypothetical protein
MTMTPAGSGSRRVKLYQPDVAELIIDAIEEGQGVTAFCKTIGFRPATFHGWVIDNVDDLAARYARAKRIGAEFLAEEARRIAAGEHRTGPDDHVAVSRDRLNADTIKWHAAKIAPTVYGDSSTLNIQSTEGDTPIVPRTPEEKEAARAAFLAKHAKGRG